MIVIIESEYVIEYCLDNLDGTILVRSWGEKGIFYNPGGTLKRGVYVLTVKEKDGENDKSSQRGRIPCKSGSAKKYIYGNVRSYAKTSSERRSGKYGL